MQLLKIDSIHRFHSIECRDRIAWMGRCNLALLLRCDVILAGTMTSSYCFVPGPKKHVHVHAHPRAVLFDACMLVSYDLMYVMASAAIFVGINATGCEW
jgi:hypothetical protein